MSVSTQITRIQTDRNTIRTKLIELGLADTTSNLDDLAVAIDGIVNRGAVQATVLEGATYTIPRGYHNGSGTVTGLSDTAGDAETYKLQAKVVTPTKNQQPISADSGYYGLSSVTVNAIPEAYQDVTSVTATAATVLTGKTFVASDGTLTAGTMINNGAVTVTLTTATTSYTIPAGYHDGTGTVSITTETKSATPTKSSQTITPSTNQVLSSVTIAPIPDEYIDTTEPEDVAAVAENILLDKVAYVNGERIEGSMANNGALSGTINGLSVTSYTVPAGYTSGGTVSLTDDIETALAAI